MSSKYNTILHGDALAMLATLPDGIVQTCVTSPPYFGLRDYGTARWEGGDDPNCDHLDAPIRTRANINRNMGTGTDRKNAEARQPFKDVCLKCFARRIDSQIGLEATPAEYVAALVAVFHEVRRVLRRDGTVWLNLGDSYANDTKWCGNGSGPMSKNYTSGLGGYVGQKAKRKTGAKPKDLLMMPARVALALQDDGWYLRAEIVWAKPNAMPESVRDRPTRSHEMVYLLSRSARYYYDADAIVEPVKYGANGSTFTRGKTAVRPNVGQGPRANDLSGRNKRDVWTVASEPYPGAHFAVMPSKLVEPCILAGSRPLDIVLDPFIGSGTVGVVAKRLGRRYIGCELNAEYIRLAERRLRAIPDEPLLTA